MIYVELLDVASSRSRTFGPYESTRLTHGALYGHKPGDLDEGEYIAGIEVDGVRWLDADDLSYSDINSGPWSERPSFT